LQRYKELQDIIAILGMEEFLKKISRWYTAHVVYSVSFLSLST
jgi:F0F1-type ATP synthase beta subunit